MADGPWNATASGAEKPHRAGRSRRAFGQRHCPAVTGEPPYSHPVAATFFARGQGEFVGGGARPRPQAELLAREDSNGRGGHLTDQAQPNNPMTLSTHAGNPENYY